RLTILIVHPFWSKTGVEAKLAMFFALEHIAVIGGLIATAIASAQRQRLRQDVSVAATYQKA
ncbi:multidrug efflux RND transporter inhibitory subunit MexG, partial [Pseudomonas aeruginosa]